VTEQFRKAPDGQPTSNIVFQLDHARRRAFNDERHLRNAEEAVVRAKKALSSRKEDVERLEWQLEQRKAEEEGYGL